jgi:hypothetical protein
VFLIGRSYERKKEHRNKLTSTFPEDQRLHMFIEFVLRCIYIEDGNRFMLSTEINKGWKQEVDIDDVKFGTESDR